ncbi:hypothetical protein C8R42DRAFT_643872 [Lentinula raphanica]|nr:hypothetical protein C8R42DRAFT_643872 [Lentinula raphanica]
MGWIIYVSTSLLILIAATSTVKLDGRDVTGYLYTMIFVSIGLLLAIQYSTTFDAYLSCFENLWKSLRISGKPGKPKLLGGVSRLSGPKVFFLMELDNSLIKRSTRSSDQGAVSTWEIHGANGRPMKKVFRILADLSPDSEVNSDMQKLVMNIDFQDSPGVTSMRAVICLCGTNRGTKTWTTSRRIDGQRPSLVSNALPV